MKINTSPSGKVIKKIQGYSIYLPNHLPPKLNWDTDLINSLSRADHILGKLSREAFELPNPHLLIRPFITKEALSSSRIEGTQATLGEVLANDAGINLDGNADDIQEVRNYIISLDYAIKKLKTFPLSLRLLRDIHKKLMKGVRGEHATPGEFRKSQNWIGAPGSTLMTAKYIPPSPDEMMDSLHHLELFLYDETLPPLIHVALCHYQFEAIHPFIDGNGRIGRLLIMLLLLKHEMLPSPILYLSAFFDHTRQEYYSSLFEVSSKGSWNSWLKYFLNGIATQSEDVLSRIVRINKLIRDWEILCHSKNLRDTINCFIVNPYLTINRVSERLDIAYTTAQRAFLKLETYGIIIKAFGDKRDKVYCAKKILDILEEPTKL